MTYQKIAELDYHFPESFPSSAQDLVSRLLIEEPQQRIGSPQICTPQEMDLLALGASDLAEIKMHSFFEGIDWERLRHSTPPEWIPAQEADQAIDLDWELKSLSDPFRRHA